MRTYQLQSVSQTISRIGTCMHSSCKGHKSRRKQSSSCSDIPRDGGQNAQFAQCHFWFRFL
jgi:hypothetical protein